AAPPRHRARRPAAADAPVDGRPPAPPVAVPHGGAPAPRVRAPRRRRPAPPGPGRARRPRAVAAGGAPGRGGRRAAAARTPPPRAAAVAQGAGPGPAWPGGARICAGAGVLVAAPAAVRRAVDALTGAHPVYQAGGAAVALAALTAPVLAAGFWVAGGAGGPLTKVNPDTVPQFVHGPRGQRTLVRNSASTGRRPYTVRRAAPPRL